MNNRTRGWLHPAVVYLLLLMVTILASWIGSILQIGSMSGNNDLTIHSVLGVSGIRWAVRSAASSLAQAPIGQAVMIFMAIGAGRGSGLFRALAHLTGLSPKERLAFIISMSILAVYILLIIMGIFTGSHLLLGVTGTLAGSPFVDGFVFLAMLGICLPALVYGLSTDTFNTAMDCVNAFCRILPSAAQFLVTMLIAAQLISTLQYTGLNSALGLGYTGMRVLSFMIYWLPLPIILLLEQKSGREA